MLNPKHLAAARQQYAQAAQLLAKNPAAFQALPVVMRKTLIRQARKLDAPEVANTLQALSDAPQFDSQGFVIADGNQKLLFDYLKANAFKPKKADPVVKQSRRHHLLALAQAHISLVALSNARLRSRYA